MVVPGGARHGRITGQAGAARLPLALLLFALAAEEARAGLPEGWVPSRIAPGSAIGFALLMGLLIFGTVTALIHLRERGRWSRRERLLTQELAEYRGTYDRAEMLLGSERQVVLSWSGRDAEPLVEGDPAALVGEAGARRLLAFGAWLPAYEAAALEHALERLRERGESFALTLRAPGDRFVEAEGRTLGGRAVLRLRDVTGDRLEVLRLRHTLSGLQGELRSLHGLLDAIRQPIWLRDGEGRIAWANQAYLAAVEARGLEDARERGLELLDRAAREEAGRRRRQAECYAARAAAVVGGQRRVLDVAEDPTPGGWAGIAVDVSELESVRASLQRQMEAHVRTLDELPTAVALFDAGQRLVFHNAAYRRLWGLDQAYLDTRPLDGEILDRLRTLRKLPEQADFRAWKASVLAAYRAMEPAQAWWYLPDRRTLRVVSNPNPQGGLTHLYEDVSEHVHLESRFNAMMRVQGETLDALGEGVAVFGTDGRLKLSNRAFAEIWRLAPGALADEPHIDAVVGLCRGLAPDDEPWGDIRAAVAGLTDTRVGLQRRILRRDGVALDCRAEPLPDGATLLAFIDVTASVNVERALTERNEALERAARLRDDFVHHVSYELRSPLTTIIGFTQLLGDETVGALNPRQREYAGHITRSSGALLAIIDDILDLASIDTGDIELACEPVDIRETVEAAVRGVEDRVEASSVALDIDVPAGIGRFIADGKRVRQVLFNLLSNAIGFSSKGQRVRLSARRDEDKVVFQVCDEGRGIPPEVMARIFNRFESHTLGTRHRGVGLGLSIVRSFVELHGGRVDVASKPGSGTTVTCTFPADGRAHRLAAE